jgi:hypothetical protein
MSLRVNPPRKNGAQTGRNSISCHCHTPLLKFIRPRGRFYGRSSRVNFPLKSSRRLRDTFSIYNLLQQSHFVGSIIFFPAGGFFEKFTINHLPSPKPTTDLSYRKKLSSFLVESVATSIRSMDAQSSRNSLRPFVFT